MASATVTAAGGRRCGSGTDMDTGLERARCADAVLGAIHSHGDGRSHADWFLAHASKQISGAHGTNP